MTDKQKIIELLGILRAKEVLIVELQANKQDLFTQLEQHDIFMSDFEATNLIDRCDKLIPLIEQGVELS